MYLRNAVAAQLLLAAVLTAQETPVAQGPTPAQQLEKLKNEKQRLEKEIEFAKERVENATSLLSSKLHRGKPNFKSIDAGKPKGMLSTQPKRIQRKAARVGTPEEMKIAGGSSMVVVNRRGISEKLYSDVSNYLMSYNSKANADLTAQRVLYDLIRIEGVAGEFVDNNGKVLLGQALAKLQSGEMSFEDAAAKYGTVQGAGKQGEMNVTRNSVQGPLFEFMAFSTEVGKVSKPFLSPRGYVVLKVEELIKGKQSALDKVACKVVLFKYTENEREMMDAQYVVTSGQAEVLVRDQEVMKKLPALYRPAAMRRSPQQVIMGQIRNLEAALKKITASGEGESDQAKGLRTQVEALKARLKQMNNEQRGEGKADTIDKVDGDAPVLKRAPKAKKPDATRGGGN